MEFLPTPEQQTWLVESLADLLRVRGTRSFLSMPIVEPTPRFFPDPWELSYAGLDRVVRRLMQYAGLGELDVNLATFVQSDPRGLSATHPSVAGAFFGIREGCCLFAFNENALVEGEHMVGVMSHEVAHAYRAHHGIVDASDRDREEWLTDVTAVYLGFGILVANNSHRYRTNARTVGGRSFHTWTTDAVGYLTPQAFAYLLAIQMDARGIEEDERRRLLRHLEANQAASVKAAAQSILDWPDEILQRLQFPQEPVERVSLETILRPLPDIEGEPEQESIDATPPAFPFNSGRPIFRLRQTGTVRYSALGLISGLTAGALGTLFHLGPFPLILAPLGFAIGLNMGRRVQYDICSDPECEAVLPPGADACPSCGGIVGGSIRRLSERLDAEEEYERTHKPRRRKKSKQRRKPPVP